MSFETSEFTLSYSRDEVGRSWCGNGRLIRGRKIAKLL